MKPLNFLISACRSCQYYLPEGRRGGMCQKLGGPVHGSWKSCALALPVFAPSWEGLEAMMLLPNETPVLLDAQPVWALKKETRGQGDKETTPWINIGA